ncbi:MAG: single-stranded-DNA-specific exonuclease RecJ [bacterium]
MNNQAKKWEVLFKDKVPKKKDLNKEEIVKILLGNRGIKTKNEAEEFFNPTLPEKLTIVSLGINGEQVVKAILRIKKAFKTQEKVIVYGDYDADGITGTAILWETLYSLGLNVLPYIPERFSEGYGLNSESIKKLKEEDPGLGLIITVDHGIVAGKKVDIAKDLGIDVIITDHHEPGKVKPKAFATIHTTAVGGAAVAWIFSQEIKKKIKTKNQKKKAINDGLDLAAIGTIADQLALIGPNRSIAKYGLEALRNTNRPGLLSLFMQAGIEKENIGPYEVGFLIAPRINATGRLNHAIDSLRLLCVKEKKRAQELSGYIGRTNTERQRIVDEVVIHARERLGSGVKDSVIILAHESYHEGVIGLAAAKLVEEFYQPAIVLSTKGDIAKASARSISGFNIIETIRKLDDLYIEGGGHPMAAGFSIETKHIEEFRVRINKIAKTLLTQEILSRKLRIDLELQFNQINQELVNALKSFEPTGLGNPAPIFMSKDINLVDARLVGQAGKHLKLKLKQDSVVFDAIAFGQGSIYPKLTKETKLDIVYNIEENIWNGNKSLQLKIKDILLVKPEIKNYNTI